MLWDAKWRLRAESFYGLRPGNLLAQSSFLLPAKEVHAKDGKFLRLTVLCGNPKYRVTVQESGVAGYSTF